MKKLILFLSLVTVIHSAKAQYVTIPDANFVTWLQSHYPSCMSGNQMDITCPALLVDTTLNLTAVNIANLDGVQYFSNLLTLKCGNYSAPRLTTIISLPSSLLRFNC